MKKDEVTEKKENEVNGPERRYYLVNFIMTGVREIATTLMCCFGRSLWLFLCTLDERPRMKMA